MDEQAKKALREIARKALEATVGGGRPPASRSDLPELNEQCGAFVTLKTRGRLRGCLGNFTSDRPLRELVAHMTRASATEDFRFFGDQIQPRELPDVAIDISVLSPLQRVADPLSIELGKHGIYVKRGAASGCFLPQVATETGWTKEEFLSQCCSGKAGLSPDAWREPDTEVCVFTAEIIEDPAPSGR